MAAAPGQISACLPAASTGTAPPLHPKLPQISLLPNFCLLSDSTGQPLPHSGPSRPRWCLTVASSGEAPAFWQPLQAQLLLPPSGLFRPSPAHASRRPSQALLLTFGGLCRPRQGPASCLPKACTGPASASQRTLHAQLAVPHCGLPSPKLLPLGRFGRPSSRLPVASSGPWGSFLTTAFPGPVFPFRRPLRAQNLLKSASPDPLAPSGHPLWAQLFFLVVSPGPTPASQQPLWTQCLPISWRPWSAHSFLKPSSPGPGQASRWPLQDELLPSDGISRPQMISGRWAPPRQARASRRPPQAQDVLKSASPGPASQQVSKLFWLNSCPAPNRICRPRTFSSQALRAHFLPPGGLYRPSTGWRTASAGPALASQGPLQAQLLPPRRPPGAKSLPASQQPACGPAPPSRWPVDAQLMPLAPCPEA
ncbi:LOW QUALITY PROTEIN: chromosome alignment-maintaining phosphoprotein 1-like [Pan paniscus]|uniref:LOW QUALITY PROTEIN: chromosome alignment-maintaining phosphoprotein 1-like n=1 Tax=Pan paniscus TaxID=9597 RepID=UPI0030052258